MCVLLELLGTHQEGPQVPGDSACPLNAERSRKTQTPQNNGTMGKPPDGHTSLQWTLFSLLVIGLLILGTVNLLLIRGGKKSTKCHKVKLKS